MGMAKLAHHIAQLRIGSAAGLASPFDGKADHFELEVVVHALPTKAASRSKAGVARSSLVLVMVGPLELLGFQRVLPPPIERLKTVISSRVHPAQAKPCAYASAPMHMPGPLSPW